MESSSGGACAEIVMHFENVVEVVDRPGVSACLQDSCFTNSPGQLLFDRGGTLTVSVHAFESEFASEPLEKWAV